MEDLEIIEDNVKKNDYSKLFLEDELKQRKVAWMAISEIWLHDEMSNYDLNYISIRLADTNFSDVTLDQIFYQEVAPVVSEGEFIMNNQWHVIEANWLEDSILKYLFEQQKKSENESFSRKMLKKFSFSKGNAHILTRQGDKNVMAEQRWHLIKELIQQNRQETQVMGMSSVPTLMAG